MSKSIEYLLTRYTDVDIKHHQIKMSILTLSNSKKTSIMLLIYNSFLDSYSIRQFDDEQKCIAFLTARFGENI